MKLIFIYGPPAAGKFTIAKELSRITDFKLFHNHIINDLLDNYLDSKKNVYWDVADTLKFKIIEGMAKEKVKGMIFTMMRAKNPRDHVLPNKIKKIVEKNKGNVYFVRLKCDEKEILKRVVHPSRKKFGKFSSRKAVKKFIKEYAPHTPLNFKNQLEINSAKTSAKKVAQQIKKYFKLR